MRIGLLAPSRRYEDSFQGGADALFRASGDNLGNFAFVEAIWRHLSPQAKILPWHVGAAEAREGCDLLVLAAANQLGPHHDLGEFAARLERIGLPVVTLGLGAQAPELGAPVHLTAGTERWARVLAALAPSPHPNIGVRGEFTRRVIEKLGLGDRVAVLGCPSLFLNERADFYPALRKRAEAPRMHRLCVAAGSPRFDGVQDIERRLVRLVAATGGAYVAQADLDMVRFARGESASSDPLERQAIYELLAPGRPAEEVELWRQRHAVCFSDATSWLDAMRAFDFAVGARFHGVMLAIQAGVPGGVIAHDSRTLELSQTTAIPVRLAGELPSDFGLQDLPRLFPFDVPLFAATRERLRRAYVGFLRRCGVEPAAGLLTLQALA